MLNTGNKRRAMVMAGWMLLSLAVEAAPAAPAPTPEAGVVVMPLTQAPLRAEAVYLPGTKLAATLPAPAPKLGTWSYEVEELARTQGCKGSGAWLTGGDSSEQYYRIQCETGAVLQATCTASGQCLVD